MRSLLLLPGMMPIWLTRDLARSTFLYRDNFQSARLPPGSHIRDCAVARRASEESGGAGTAGLAETVDDSVVSARLCEVGAGPVRPVPVRGEHHCHP